MGMGGKANCLCLRGIWETPKPRYREETKPVVELPGTTFVPEIHPVRIARTEVSAWRGDRGAEGRARRLTRAERHGRGRARCLGPVVRVRSAPRPQLVPV